MKTKKGNISNSKHRLQENYGDNKIYKSMTENEFILEDRIGKIQAINKEYDLENNAHISFSGGKDSCVLSKLMDLALPNNKIPRIYANTGIEYIDMVKFVKDQATKDNRIIVLQQNKNIRKTLETYGYPFKSKLHSQKVLRAQRLLRKGKEISPFLKEYINTEDKSYRKCPKDLVYQFKEVMPYLVSDMCCNKLKKALFTEFEYESNRRMVITGMRADEGGARQKLTCLSHNNTKFHPLIVVSDEWEEWFIKKYDIKLCKLYYPPYNFNRTGCRGCPFSLTLEKDLLTMKKLLPIDYNASLNLWKPVYDEYVRLGYRLSKDFYTKSAQYTIEDYLEL